MTRACVQISRVLLPLEVHSQRMRGKEPVVVEGRHAGFSQ